MWPSSVHGVGAVHVGRWRPTPVAHEHRGPRAVLTETVMTVIDMLVIYNKVNVIVI